MKRKPEAKSNCAIVLARPIDDQDRTYKARQILPTIRVASILADRSTIPQHKANLDNPTRARQHQRIPKRRMHHRAQHQFLRMRTHGESSQENNNSRDDVPLRSSISLSAEPDTHESCTPPHNAHRSVLQVVVNPRTAPSVLGECVDAAPSRDDDAVEELLRSARTSDPALTNEEQ